MGLIPQTLVPCGLPESPEGCGQLFDMAERFLVVVLDTLESFANAEECDGCDPLSGYISLGPPPIAPGRGEGAFIWLVSYNVRAERSQQGLPGGRQATTIFDAQWRVELWESCYPTLGGTDAPEWPSLEYLHEVHRHVYAHALSSYSAMWGAWTDPQDQMYPSCDELRFGPLLPIEPQGGYAGFRWDVSGPIAYSDPM